MGDPLPNRKKGNPKRASINFKRAQGQERRVRQILEDAKADGLVEVEIDGKPISLLNKKEIDAVVKQVLKDQGKEDSSG